MNRFEKIYSFVEATKLWELKDSTLRKALQYGRFEEDVDVKKFGRDWVVTEEAMLREYGKPKIIKY